MELQLMIINTIIEAVCKPSRDKFLLHMPYLLRGSEANEVSAKVHAKVL